MNTHRPIALLAALALTLAACGGDDDSVPAADEPSAQEPSAEEPAAEEPAADEPADEPAAEPAAPVEGPVSTLSPDIPEGFLPGLGPVDVTGASLPPLEDGADPAVGMAAPVLVGLDLDRMPIRIDPASDGPTMIVFVAHWCPHCNDELPRLNELRDEGRFPADLNIVAVSTAIGPDRPNWPPDEWLTDTMEWTYPAMFDAIDLERQTYIAADAYGVTGFPFVTLVDGDGAVAARWSGERDPDEIVGEIEAALG